MFGIGSWEFLIVAMLALLLFGPDKLPDFARTIGRFMRDFRRYQSMMESTIRAEVFASDPKLQKDPFKKGKEFGEKVGSGGFTRPGPTASKDDAGEASSAETPASESGSPAPAGETPAPESGGSAPVDEPAAPAGETGEEGAEKA